MRKSTFIIAVLAALAAALASAGCSAAHVQAGVQPHSAGAHTPSSASAPAVASPSPAATAIPLGIWNAVSTSDPADVYGQYSITESDGQYILTTNTALKLVGGLPNGCSLPPGTEEATFSASSTDGNGPAIYQGSEKYWYTNTCGYSDTYPATLGVLSANKMVLAGAVTLIRAGSTLSQPSTAPSSPVASQGSATPSAAATTPSAVSTVASTGGLTGTWVGATTGVGAGPQQPGPFTVGITKSGGDYKMTSISLIPFPDLDGSSCTIPSGVEIAYFPETPDQGVYSGRLQAWVPNSKGACVPGPWQVEIFTATAGGKITMNIPDLDGILTTLTRYDG
jgi:hypothetical protein